MFTIQPHDDISWMAPYAYAIVLLGFGFILFRIFENWYAARFDKPLFRHYWVYKKLSPSQIQILEKEFIFYQALTPQLQRQFCHRVATFLVDKKYIGREGLEVTERMRVLIAAVGCMLSFGRRNYEYALIENILVFPNEFYSARNDSLHQGEFNPRDRALVLSWHHFEKGFQIDNDNLNLGIHEFMHAMQLEATNARDLDSNRFAKQFQNILKTLVEDETREKLDQTRYFRSYAFTNQFEFMAVLAEYFIESPKDFKGNFPKLYQYTQKLLNFTFAGY